MSCLRSRKGIHLWVFSLQAEQTVRSEKRDLEVQLEDAEKSLFQSRHDNSSLSDQLQKQKTELTKQIVSKFTFIGLIFKLINLINNS